MAKNEKKELLLVGGHFFLELNGSYYHKSERIRGLLHIKNQNLNCPGRFQVAFR